MISYEKLWKAMKERGVTQYTLIKKYGVSPGQISRAAQSLRLHTRYFLTERRKACPERTTQYD